MEGARVGLVARRASEAVRAAWERVTSCPARPHTHERSRVPVVPECREPDERCDVWCVVCVCAETPVTRLVSESISVMAQTGHCCPLHAPARAPAVLDSRLKLLTFKTFAGTGWRRPLHGALLECRLQPLPPGTGSSPGWADPWEDLSLFPRTARRPSPTPPNSVHATQTLPQLRRSMSAVVVARSGV